MPSSTSQLTAGLIKNQLVQENFSTFLTCDSSSKSVLSKRAIRSRCLPQREPLAGHNGHRRTRK